MAGLLFAAGLWADAPARPPGPSLLRDANLLIATGSLVLALLAAAMVLFLIDRWKKRQFEGGGVQESAESLSTFRDLFERGELSAAEYAKVRAKMAAKIRQEVAGDVPPPGKPVVPPPAGGAGSGGPTDGGELSPGAGSAPGPDGPPGDR